MKQVRRKTAGISETVAVLFMILVAVFFAGLVAIFLLGSIQRQTATPVEVRQMTTGQCIIYFNVRNTGGQSFARLEIEVSGPGGTRAGPYNIPLSSPLNPGMMYADRITASCQPGWTAGTALLVRVTATTPTNVQGSKNVHPIIQFGA
jgi:FlaG/FlaF family flagellin (archaellin)